MYNVMCHFLLVIMFYTGTGVVQYKIQQVIHLIALPCDRL